MNEARITSPFDGQCTAAEVVAGIDLAGRRAIVTGGSSGIGVETARALAGARAEVTLAVRNVEMGLGIAANIIATTGNDRVLVAPLDLADQSSIAAFVAGWDTELHILINNAGVAAAPETRTPEGWELQFATNYLGHFTLALGLHDALSAGRPARIVSLISNAHLGVPIDFDDINFHTREYDRMEAYGQSKTATGLFAVEANRRWAPDGITTNAVDPGSVVTNLGRHLTEEDMAGLPEYDYKTPEQGAGTSVFVATSPLLDDVGGRFFEDCREAEPYRPDRPLHGVAEHARDPRAAARLWQLSLDLLAAA